MKINKRWLHKLAVFLVVVLLTATKQSAYSQWPVSTYSDKGGDWTDYTSLSSQSAVTSFNMPFTYLKIYKGRKYDKLESATKLKATTILVVIDNEESAYGKALKKAFTDYWKFTPFKFIKSSEVVNYVDKSGFSFFMFTRDEHFSGEQSTAKGMTQVYGEPHLYYMSDSMQHKPRTGFHMGASGDFESSYLFVVAVSNGKKSDDNSEESITSSLSIADYILAPSALESSYENSGTLAEKENETMPQLSEVIKNLEKDLEYMNTKKKEKFGTNQTYNYSAHTDGNTYKYKLGVITYEGGKETWKNKTLFINKSLCNDFGRGVIAGLLDLDDKKVKLVSRASIDSLTKANNNENIMVWDTLKDEAGGYMISAADGTELVGLDVEGINEIFKNNRRNPTPSYQTGKCELIYNDKDCKFSFYYVVYGKINLKNKVLFINIEIVDELGRAMIAKILEIDDKNVKLVTPSTIDSVIKSGNNANMVFPDNMDDDKQDYIISTPDGVQVIGLPKRGYNKEVGTLELTGEDKWSERSKFSVK